MWMNGSFLKEDYNLTIVSPEAVVQSWALSYYPYIYDDLHQSTKLGICALTNTRYDIMGTKFSTECKIQKILWDISWWGWWVRKAVCEKAIHFSTFSASRHPAVGWICSLRWSKALLTLCLPSTLIDDKLLFFSSPRHVAYLFCFMKLSKHRCGVVIKASWRCFLYGRCWKTSPCTEFSWPTL